jgi:hypothetical protein
MRYNYLFVLILLIIQGLILSVEYRESDNIKTISRIFHQKENAFTEIGKERFRQSMQCLDSRAKNRFLNAFSENPANVEYIAILETLIKSYPIQVQRTVVKNDRVILALFFDLPKPVVIQINAVQVDGEYKIDSISHLCELFECVNRYFEHKTIE